MTSRFDVVQDFNPSPRVSVVDAPSVEFVAQDIIDTLRDREQNTRGISELKLINGSGKENLGGGVNVGITLELQDNLIAFEGRTTPAETGTVTTGSSAPVSGLISFTDTAALFQTNNVARGSLIVNFTDNSIAEVHSVDSETVLTTKTLVNGTGNTFDSSDVYHVFNIIQCEVLGGNVVAVDDMGTTISPILPTAFTQVVRSLSSSATSQNQSAIEYASFGDQVTLDVINGEALNGADPLDLLIGTKERPVDNAIDARTIADSRGFKKFGVRGNYTFTTGDDISTFSIEGENPTQTVIVCDPGADTTGAEFFECHLQGTLDGGSTIRQCLLTNLIYVNGFVHDSILSQGDITLAGGATAYFLECKTGLGLPTIDHGGSGQALVMQNYSGNITHKNKTGTDAADCLHLGGTVTVEATVTDGPIYFTGTGEVVNDATRAVVVDKMLHGAKVDNIRQLVELLRPSHSGSGTVCYWSPYDGDDTLLGDHIDRAVKTFAQAHSLVTSGGHDVIVCISRDPSGITTTNEEIVLSKNNVFVRGTGRDFRIVGDNDLVDTVEVTGDNCEISGMTISSNSSSTKHQLHLNGSKNTIVKDTWCFEGGSGVLLTDTEDCTFNNTRIAHNTGNGMEIQGTSEHTAIENCHISSNTLTGILMSSTGHEISVTQGSILHSNGAYGIDIEAGSNGIHILGSVVMYANGTADIRDLGTGTYDISNTEYKTLQMLGKVDKAIHVDTEQIVNGDGSQGNPYNNLNDTLTFAEAEGLKIIHVLADITIDRNLKNFIVVGIGTPAIDCAGFSLNKSEFTHCTMKGQYTGTVIAQECVLFDGFYLQGYFENCALGGDLICIAGADVLIKDCASGIAGLGRPSISMSVAGTSNLSVRGYNGGLDIRDCNQATDDCTVEVNPGSVSIAASCTDGNIVLRGTGEYQDSSAGTTITDEMVHASDIEYIKDLTEGRWLIDEATNQMVFYKADNTTEIARFDLKDISGNAASTNVFERVKV